MDQVERLFHALGFRSTSLLEYGDECGTNYGDQLRSEPDLRAVALNIRLQGRHVVRYA